jgi:FkbM family methyltransferase
LRLLEKLARWQFSLLPPDARQPASGGRSYSQQGEDLIIEYYFRYLGIDQPSYLDVGAWDPIIGSNTFKFYEKGAQGVLVEPDAQQCAKLASVRPRDVVLNCAVRTESMPPEIELYVMSFNSLSTVVHHEAIFAQESRTWGEQRIVETRKVKAVTVNELLQEQFPRGVDLIDIDIEGLDLEVLSELDFERFRPKVLLVEISGHYAKKDQDNEYSSTDMQSEFENLMKQRGYHLLIPPALNGIFVRD